MNATALHALPRWPTIALRQIALPIAAGRVYLLIAACLISLSFEEGNVRQVSGLTAEQIAVRLQNAPESAVVEAFGNLMWIALGWSLLLWWGEGRKQRRYHWTMPVSHSAHDLTRVLSGAMWLMVGVAFYCVAGVLFARNDVAIPLSAYPLSLWINFFSMPLLVYSFASIITLFANRPLEWSVGLFLGFSVLAAVTGEFVSRKFESIEPTLMSLERPFQSVAFADFGFATSFVGGWYAAKEQAKSAFSSHSPQLAPPSLSQFLIAAAVWGVAAVLGLVLVSRKRP